MYDVIQVHHITLMTAYVYIYIYIFKPVIWEPKKNIYICISFTSHCLAISNDKKQSLKWALVLQKSSNANAPTIRYPHDIGQGELEIEECAKVLEPFSHACGMFLDVTFSSWILQIFLDIFSDFVKFHTYRYSYLNTNSIVCIRQLHVYMHILSSCLMCCCVVLYVLLKLGVWLMVATVSTRKL